jgi:hypothetical protein
MLMAFLRVPVQMIAVFTVRNNPGDNRIEYARGAWMTFAMGPEDHRFGGYSGLVNSLLLDQITRIFMPPAAYGLLRIPIGELVPRESKDVALL